MKIEILQPQGINEIGNRQNQEDSLFPSVELATADDRLFMVCDGMGGHEHGEVASQLVCNVLSEYLKEHWADDSVLSDDVLQDALDEVFRKINALDNGSMRQMGTTLTLLALHRGGVTMAHLGDSRIYHLRPSQQRILYKSRDHSLAYDLFLAGELTFDEMTHYDRKNVITRAIMPGMERQPKLDIAHTTDLQPGDYFLLCSDGLLERMDDGQLLQQLSTNTPDEDKRRQIVIETEKNADNHSAWLIHIKSVTQESDDAQQKNDEATVRCNAMRYETAAIEKQSSLFSRLKKWLQ
jgi:protein phosphatase